MERSVDLSQYKNVKIEKVNCGGGVLVFFNNKDEDNECYNCSYCNKELPKFKYSKNQISNEEKRKCNVCLKIKSDKKNIEIYSRLSSVNNNWFVLMVHSNGIWGFPKGGREKGENYLITSLRELQEETSLTEEEIDLFLPVSEVFIDEINRKGNLSVRYLLAFLKPNLDMESVNLQPFDEEEIINIGFYPIQDSLQMLIPQRQKVIIQALDIIENHINNDDSGENNNNN
eukprot:TRINITY_DN443_c3_g1_i1.p1 TRINITY_DN443_c3_g1~~TRINITY_DN443_c3_g1_i1.p1  ORF type:complete len:229 (+),score=71.29 TRINITY_DN443_c3_g1_i1:212-898(+)